MHESLPECTAVCDNNGNEGNNHLLDGVITPADL